MKKNKMFTGWTRSEYETNPWGYMRERDEYVYPTTFDKNTRLEDSPHYTDKRFDHKEQTIFGEKLDGLGYDYSDRIWQWDYDKAEKATEIANASGASPHTCRWYENYLSAFFDKKVTIYHIIAGVNWSSGYPYLVFGYKTE